MTEVLHRTLRETDELEGILARASGRWRWMGVSSHLRVLYTTGYSRNAIVHHGRLDPGVNLISKPFTFDELAARVRDILDFSPGRKPGEG